VVGTGAGTTADEAPIGELAEPDCAGLEAAGDVETSDVPGMGADWVLTATALEVEVSGIATGVLVICGTATGVEVVFTIGTMVVVVCMELAGQLSTSEWQLVMTMVLVEYWVSSMVEGA